LQSTQNDPPASNIRPRIHQMSRTLINAGGNHASGPLLNYRRAGVLEVRQIITKGPGPARWRPSQKRLVKKVRQGSPGIKPFGVGSSESKKPPLAIPPLEIGTHPKVPPDTPLGAISPFATSCKHRPASCAGAPASPCIRKWTIGPGAGGRFFQSTFRVHWLA